VFLEPGPALEQAVTIVRAVAWSVVLLGCEQRAGGRDARERRGAGAGAAEHGRDRWRSSGRLPWRWKRASAWPVCSGPVRPAFLAMLVLHGLYYRHKEKKDGLFRQPGVALGAAGSRAPGA
jgi:hypothetical protein